MMMMKMMITMMITMMMMIMINYNDFISFALSRLTHTQLHRKPSPTRTLKWPPRNRVQITCNTSIAYHLQHVVLRATQYEGKAQVLSLTEFKPHLF